MKISLEITIEFDEDLLLEKKKGKFVKFISKLPFISGKVKDKIKQEIKNQISYALESELDAVVEINEM